MITLHGIEQIILATACCVFLIAAPTRAFAAATLDDEPLRRRNKNREICLHLICDCTEIVGAGAVAVAACLIIEVLIRAAATAMILPNLPGGPPDRRPP